MSNDKWIETERNDMKKNDHVPCSLRYAPCALLVRPRRSSRRKSRG